MSPIASLILFGFMCGAANARYVNKESEASTVAVVSGTLYVLENGQSRYRLNRRDLDAVQFSFQEMRLDLGPGMDAIDMQLKQDSAWSNDSRIVVRRGNHVEEAHNSVDSSCYLSGRLTSHNGAATLSRCGRMTGLIEVGEHHYVIEETDDGNLDAEISNVKVTMKRSSLITSKDDGVVKGYKNDEVQIKTELKSDEDIVKGFKNGEIQEKDEIKFDENNVKENENDEVEDKDKVRFDEVVAEEPSNSKTAEIGVYLDKNIINWWRNNRDLETDGEMINFIVQKWNIIRCVYGNQIDVGFPFAIELKYIEIWRENPPAYETIATTETNSSRFLHGFCQLMANDPDDSFDHVMLYTQGTVGYSMGRAFLGGICQIRLNCAFAKAKEDGVRIEVHELGHNLGLTHDTENADCLETYPPGGFMAWSWNNKIMPCYRRLLAQTLDANEKPCLVENNVERRVYNTNPPADCIRPGH